MKHVTAGRLGLLIGLLLLSAGFVNAQGKVMNFNTNANGEDIPAGTVISDQYSAWGISIQTFNNHRKHPSKAVIFNSSNPSGGDVDLGTPNEQYQGPGRGEGGASNKTALGNLLIIAENDKDANKDGLIDDPDDEATGGVITFQFDDLMNIQGITLVDIDKNESSAVIRYTSRNGESDELPISGLGDNSVVEINQQWKEVTELRIELPGSGAIAEIRFE